MKKFIKWFLIRLPIFLIIVFLVILLSLKMAQRNPGPLKEGLENFLSEASGESATITEVNHIKFVPAVSLDLGQITFHDRSNAAIVNLSLDKLVVDIPAWSVLLGAGRINNVSVENLTIAEGDLAPFDLKIENVAIVDYDGPDQYGSFVEAKGEYRNQPAFLEIKIKKLEKGYKIPKDITLSLNVGEYELDTQVVKSFSTTTLRNTVLRKAGNASTAKSYNFIKKKKYDKNNPLTCIIEAEHLTECDIYLTQ